MTESGSPERGALGAAVAVILWLLQVGAAVAVYGSTRISPLLLPLDLLKMVTGLGALLVPYCLGMLATYSTLRWAFAMPQPIMLGVAFVGSSTALIVGFAHAVRMFGS
jgi:hypothetical protein